MMNDSSGTLENYPCPFYGCKSVFTADTVARLYSLEENTVLLRLAQKRFISSF
jgi:hypothetical protein